MIEDVASSDILQEEVDSVVSLEHVVHSEDEWILGLEKDIFLGLCVEDLTFLNEDVLVDSLHSILLAISLANNVKDLAEASLVDDLSDLEVLQLHPVGHGAQGSVEALPAIRDHG